MLVVPLAVALVVLRDPRWYPALELAQTELHTRDVGTSHAPLTGLIGRLGAVEQRGSHPGPLSFYALAPAYRLAGSSAWALELATVVLHLSAVGLALWITHRRGGMRLLLLTAAVLTALLRFYGASVLTEPWNPYLPMLWWLVFALSVWSVVDDDPALLPVAVVAGSLCSQTHISYVGLVGGLGGGAVATVLVRGVRRRRSGGAPERAGAWLIISAAVGAVLWLPPIIDEVRREPGNLSILVDYFTASSEDPIGLRRGAELLLADLDPWRLLFGHAETKVVREPPSWSIAGLLYLAAWIVSIVVAWRLRHRSLLRLHAVLGIALGFGALSLSRIYGYTWAWLVQWVPGLTALLAVAIAWTFGCAARRALLGSPKMRPIRIGTVSVLTIVALGSAIASTNDAAHVERDDVASSRALQRLVPATVKAIDGGTGPGGGREGSYFITWTDPIGVVGDLQGYGLTNELDREGIEVGFESGKHLRAAPYLTMDSSQATAVLRLVIGPAIEEWDRKAAARRIASYDPRTREERDLQERLRSEIDEELRGLGLAEVIPQLDASFIGSMFALGTDPRIPESLTDKMTRVVGLGYPSAVFIEEPTTTSSGGGSTLPQVEKVGPAGIEPAT